MKWFGLLGTALAVTFLGLPIVLADAGANHQAKQTPPIRLGTSGGSALDKSNAFCCGGTLGAAVFCGNALSVLSNNHVLGRSGVAGEGEDTVQPGLIDSGCQAKNSNFVADYAGDLVQLGKANVDGAIAFARPGMVNSTGEILDIGVPCVTPKTATIGMSVAKSGRTTGLTIGTVQAVNLNVSIQYQKGCNSGKKFTITYTNQISVTPGSFSAGGDSGSLIVTNDTNHQPVGLLFAGSNSITIANPIEDVINAFSTACGTFSFVGTTCLTTASGTASVSSAVTPLSLSPSNIEVATRVKEQHAANLMSHPAILGVGVGASEDDPNEAAIIIYVQEGRVIDRPIPNKLDGVKVRIILTGPIVAK